MMNIKYLLFLLVISAMPINAQTLIFPHIADGHIGDGTRWSTEIDLINSSTISQTADIAFYNPDGSNKCILFSRSQGDLNACPGPATITLRPNEIRAIIIDSGLGSIYPVKTGWAIVQGSGGIKGLLVFRRIEGLFDGKIVSEAAFNPQADGGSIEFFPRVNLLAAGGQSQNHIYIGLAIVNPNAISAIGEIQIIDASAQIIGHYPLMLAPHQQSSFYLEEIFNSALSPSCYARIIMAQGAVSAIGIRSVDLVISAIAPSL